MWVLMRPGTPITPPEYLRSIDYPDGDRRNMKVQFTGNFLEAKRYVSPAEVQMDGSMTGMMPMPIPMR